MTTTPQPRNVHPIDMAAQELWDAVQSRIEYLRGRIAGPTPVGTRKMTARDWARQILQMPPDKMLQLMDTLPQTSPAFATAFDMLGAHGMALLPYLQPQMNAPEPQPGGQEGF